MDGWLKALIAAACVAVIAFVGFYFWKESAAADQAKADAETARYQRLCREARDHLARYERGEPQGPGMENREMTELKVKGFCR